MGDPGNGVGAVTNYRGILLGERITFCLSPTAHHIFNPAIWGNITI